MQNGIKINGNRLTGYLAVFNSLSQVMQRSDGTRFVEIIRSGAFTQTLADGHNIWGLIGHDTQRVLGSTGARTVKLTQDKTGLYAEIQLPDTSDVRDLKSLIARGEAFGGSFTGTVADWRWSRPDMGSDLRMCEVLKCSLVEVTITTVPVYAETSVVLRSMKMKNGHPPITDTEHFAYRLRAMKASL